MGALLPRPKPWPKPPPKPRCAIAVAALTIYDMVKAVDKAMVIGDIRLEFKSGGRSGTYRRP